MPWFHIVVLIENVKDQTQCLWYSKQTTIIEQFCPAFAPGCVVLYIGDTENKFVHLETTGLAALGVTLDSAAKIPDVFVTAFETRRTMQAFVSHIAWESEVWIAEDPDHMIHFNGERFLGPYPDVMPTEP